MLAVAWPSCFWTALTLDPWRIISDAAVCRRSYSRYGEVRTGRFSTVIACRFDPDSRQVISSERVTPLYRADTRA
jgi:hypothetical protein